VQVVKDKLAKEQTATQTLRGELAAVAKELKETQRRSAEELMRMRQHLSIVERDAGIVKQRLAKVRC